MKSQGISGNFTEANVDALAVAVFKDEKVSTDALKQLDGLSGGLVSALLRAEEFKGDAGETTLVRFNPSGKGKASRLLLVGAGDRSDYKVSKVAEVAGAAARALRKVNVKSFALLPRSDAPATDVAQSAAMGVVTSHFELDKYKTKDKNDKSIQTFVLCVEGAKPADLKAGLSRGQAIGESINFTR